MPPYDCAAAASWGNRVRVRSVFFVFTSDHQFEMWHVVESNPTLLSA